MQISSAVWRKHISRKLVPFDNSMDHFFPSNVYEVRSSRSPVLKTRLWRVGCSRRRQNLHTLSPFFTHPSLAFDLGTCRNLAQYERSIVLCCASTGLYCAVWHCMCCTESCWIIWLPILVHCIVTHCTVLFWGVFQSNLCLLRASVSSSRNTQRWAACKVMTKLKDRRLYRMALYSVVSWRSLI